MSDHVGRDSRALHSNVLFDVLCRPGVIQLVIEINRWQLPPEMVVASVKTFNVVAFAPRAARVTLISAITGSLPG